MYQYPYSWQQEGYVSQYVRDAGYIQSAPKRGEYVFQSWNDGSPAFRVLYANKGTARILVKKTKKHIKYNDVLREHRKKSGGRGLDPSDSKIFLVENK
jgi:hypothetical protein